MSQSEPPSKDRIWIACGAGLVLLTFVAGLIQRKFNDPRGEVANASTRDSTRMATTTSEPIATHVLPPQRERPTSAAPITVDEEAKDQEVETETDDGSNPPVADLVLYEDPLYHYSLRVPKGWTISKSRQGQFWRTSFAGPKSTRILVEVNDKSVPDLAAGWKELSDRFAKAYKDNYRGISIGPLSLAGKEGSCWLFELKKRDEPWLRKCDIAIHVGSNTYALLFEAPVDSYNEMSSIFGQVKETLIVGQLAGADSSTIRSDNYMLASHAVTDSDLQGKTGWDLTLMRNEIYARHGYVFHRSDLQTYFASKPWYHGTQHDSQAIASKLSNLEKINAAAIATYQGLHHLK